MPEFAQRSGRGYNGAVNRGVLVWYSTMAACKTVCAASGTDTAVTKRRQKPLVMFFAFCPPLVKSGSKATHVLSSFWQAISPFLLSWRYNVPAACLAMIGVNDMPVVLSFSRFCLQFGHVAVIAATAASLIVAPRVLWAQTAFNAPQAASVPPPPTAPTLDKALRRVPWDASQGVLLTLSPDVFLPGAPNNHFNTGRDLFPISAESASLLGLLQAAPQDGQGPPLHLATVAHVWKRQVQAFGGVSVVAPATMTVLNPKPSPPALAAGLGEDEVSQAFFASLSPTQWRLLASRNGIGRSDLQAHQVDFFDRLVPRSLSYTVAYPRGVSRNAPAAQQTLTSDEQQAVRLRVKLQTTVSALFREDTSGSNFFSILFNGNRGNPIYGDKTPFLALVHSRSNNEENSGGMKDQIVYGVTLAHEVRNKPKPADLDFAVVSGIISLLPPPPQMTDGKSDAHKPVPILTVSDLIPRFRQATGLDIYADARLLDERVWTRGASIARAGDVLQALCFGIGGTVRKVEVPGEKPAYVITSDLQGAAARFMVLDDWWAKAQIQKQTTKADYLQKIRAINPLAFLLFDEKEPLKISRDLLLRVAASGRDHKGGLLIKPSELTPSEQGYLNQQVVNSNNDKGFEVKGTQYKIGVGLWLGIVVPGIGEITTTEIGSVGDLLPEPAKAAPMPSPAQGAGLWVRVPDRDDEAARTFTRELVEIAAHRQIGALYLDGASFPVLQAAAEQATSRAYRSGEPHLSVWGVLHPLHVPPNAPFPAPDLNAAGQTSAQYKESRADKNKKASSDAAAAPPSESGDWRIDSDKETARAAQKQAFEMAAVPGLAGILVADALPPGYRNGVNYSVSSGGSGDGGNPDFHLGAGLELGWTPKQRLHFLRENSADPADIVPYISLNDVQIPFFPEPSHGGTGLTDAWSKWRAERGQAFLTQLRQSIETARPGLPVQVCGQLNEKPLLQTPTTPWIVDWFPNGNQNVRLFWSYSKRNTPLAMQAKQGLTGSTHNLSEMPRAFLRVPPQNAAEAWVRGGGAGWDGVVFDFSGLPPGEAVERLHVLLGPLP